jgi:exoribonuclease R
MEEKTLIPAILVFGNKTYGKKGIGNNVKYYYKCYPIGSETYPRPLLVPFKPDLSQFSKKLTNKYILIHQLSETHAKIVETLGSVDDFEAYCQWELHKLGLNKPINELNKAIKRIHLHSEPHLPSEPSSLLYRPDYFERFCNMRERKVYTMDPPESKDFDDAFSIQENSISIYITNVAAFLDSFSLFKSMGERTSTIYFPGFNYPMLPKKLSEEFCSLKEGLDRAVLVFEYHFDQDKVQFYTATIKVTKNLTYEGKSINDKSDKIYSISKKLLQKTRDLNQKKHLLESIDDTHDAIAFLMLFMNSEVAKRSTNSLISESDNLDQLVEESVIEKLKEPVNLIYRNCLEKPDITNVSDPELSKFLSYFNSSGSTYSEKSEKHAMLNLDSYTHITSPIRRLVDLLNMISFQHSNNLYVFTDDALNFHKKWYERIEQINKEAKKIRQIQTKASLLKLCLNSDIVVTISNIDHEYKGFPISKTINDNSESNYNVTKNQDFSKTNRNYDVYLPKLKMLTKVSSDQELLLNTKYLFKIYLFTDESTFHKKVRVGLSSVFSNV